jgi:hypothetical protein
MNARTRSAQKKSRSEAEDAAAPVAEQQNYAGIGKTMEFGGPIGVTALMIWSHYILIYFW